MGLNVQDILVKTPVRKEEGARGGDPVKEKGKKGGIRRVLDFSTSLRKFGQANGGSLRRAAHHRGPTSTKNWPTLGSWLHSVIG